MVILRLGVAPCASGQHHAPVVTIKRTEEMSENRKLLIPSFFQNSFKIF
jgi:hypothetical protein